MTLGSLAVALVAGMLSVLSPCVLPILPIVLGAAASERKWGPVALATGLSISFMTIGMFRRVQNRGRREIMKWARDSICRAYSQVKPASPP